MRDGDVGAVWIIPAYAGSTVTSVFPTRVSRGSSPHTRGARPRCICAPGARGDHPRIRGEHLVVGDGARLREGIIPAYAGSTVCLVSHAIMRKGSSPHTRGAPASRALPSRRTRDHPRIRGEHRRDCRECHDAGGIIPAYAGSTAGSMPAGTTQRGSSPHTRGAPTSPSRRAASPRDHPRIRGEHGVRGVRHELHAGIIPAYAGSTTYSPKVHLPEQGSSPHTRGARRHAARDVRRVGSSPHTRGAR